MTPSATVTLTINGNSFTENDLDRRGIRIMVFCLDAVTMNAQRKKRRPAPR